MTVDRKVDIYDCVQITDTQVLPVNASSLHHLVLDITLGSEEVIRGKRKVIVRSFSEGGVIHL